MRLSLLAVAVTVCVLYLSPSSRADDTWVTVSGGKSRKGSETPRQTTDLIRKRLHAATVFHAEMQGGER